MSDPISLALGIKETLWVFGGLISANVISFRYIFNSKSKIIDELGKRVAKVEQHRWDALNKLGAEFLSQQQQYHHQHQEQWQQINGRIDDMYRLFSSRKQD